MKKYLKNLILAIILFVASVLGASADHIEPMNDGGGSVLTYIGRIEAFEETSKTRVLTGSCRSACTMWLGAQNACIHLPFTAGFHDMKGQVPFITSWVKSQYEAHLPLRLRQWYRQNADDSLTITNLTGRQLIRDFGIPECGHEKRMRQSD